MLQVAAHHYHLAAAAAAISVVDLSATVLLEQEAAHYGFDRQLDEDDDALPALATVQRPLLFARGRGLREEAKLSAPPHSEPEPSTSDGAPVVYLGGVEQCAVCGDKVNGHRYGAPACLGCIVFFRRSIVRNSVFTCQRHGRCAIDHKSRCTCRHCRLQKCFSVGMNPNSIQRRDMMGPRKKKSDGNVKDEECSPPCASEAPSPRPPSLPLCSPTSTIHPQLLMLSAMQDKQRSNHRSWFTAGGPHAADPSFLDGIANLVSALAHLPTTSNGHWTGGNGPSATGTDHHSGIGRPSPAAAREEYHSDVMRRARKQDVNTMLHLCIIDCIEWAMQFAPFADLKLDVKREVLQEFSIAFMLVDQGYNTSRQHDPTLWMLQHDKVYMCVDYMRGLPVEEQKLPLSETKAKLHPDFVSECLSGIAVPMREMRIELFECAVLKSILLFECHNVYPRERRPEIASYKERCLQSLAAYEASEHPSDAVERIGTLILMIANVRSCIVATYRQIAVSEIFSLMSFDALVSDIMLRRT